MSIKENPRGRNMNVTMKRVEQDRFSTLMLMPGNKWGCVFVFQLSANKLADPNRIAVEKGIIPELVQALEGKDDVAIKQKFMAGLRIVRFQDDDVVWIVQARRESAPDMVLIEKSSMPELVRILKELGDGIEKDIDASVVAEVRRRVEAANEK